MARSRTPAEVTASFWSHVQKSDGCWTWTAHRDAQGYGKSNLNRRQMLAHRLSYTLNVGPIPAGLCVLHHCDSPPCVRPDHLFLGTNADNIADMMAKGRHVPGTRTGPHATTLKWNGRRAGSANPFAKLTDAAVADIRRERAAGRAVADLASTHGVSRTTIRDITTGRAWTHVPIAA